MLGIGVRWRPAALSAQLPECPTTFFILQMQKPSPIHGGNIAKLTDLLTGTAQPGIYFFILRSALNCKLSEWIVLRVPPGT